MANLKSKEALELIELNERGLRLLQFLYVRAPRGYSVFTALSVKVHDKRPGTETNAPDPKLVVEVLSGLELLGLVCQPVANIYHITKTGVEHINAMGPVAMDTGAFGSSGSFGDISKGVNKRVKQVYRETKRKRKARHYRAR